jgi:hypothetical protein
MSGAVKPSITTIEIDSQESISGENIPDEEELQKKAIHTIYEQLKEVRFLSLSLNSNEYSLLFVM